MDRQQGGGVDPQTGRFVDVDLVSGAPGSNLLAAWANANTEELRNLVVESGQTPDIAKEDQVRRAVAILAARAGSNPNLLINGSMEFWHRGLSRNLPQLARYTADRWHGDPGSGSATVTRMLPSSGGSPPEGLRNHLRFQQTVMSTAGNSKLLQRVEDVTLTAGRTVTLSWWQKRGTAYPVSVTLTQNFGVGGSNDVTVGTEQVASLPHDGDWEKAEFTFAVPAVGAATVGDSSFLEIAFILPTGSTFEWAMAQAQLEFGDTATPFEYLPRSVEELLCARYFWTTYEHGTQYGTVTKKGAQVAFESYFRAQGLQIRFPVSMRATPTITWLSPITGTAGKVDVGTTGDVAVLATEEGSTVASGYPYFGTAQPEVNMQAHVTADAEL